MVSAMTVILPATGYVRVFVPGVPAPQGSKSYMGKRKNGSAILIESSRQVKPWREAIAELLRKEDLPLFVYPKDIGVHATLTFIMPRVKRLRAGSAPAHTVKPDLDKLARAVLDAVGMAQVWVDDSQVTMLSAHKRYADPFEDPGVAILLQPLTS